MAHGDDAVQVVGLALIPLRRGHERGDGRVRRVSRREFDSKAHDRAVRDGDDLLDREARLAPDTAQVERDEHEVPAAQALQRDDGRVQILASQVDEQVVGR